MKKWTAASFIRAFIHDELNRKRVHGTYRVLMGDHCKLLVKSTTDWGKPAGSDLVAIRLDNEDLNLFFFHDHNTFLYRLNSDLDVYNAPKLPASVLDSDDPNLLSSGIIDIKGNDVLIEIGDKPYLLHRKLGDTKTPVLPWAPGDGTLSVTRFESLDDVPTRVSTVEEARELVKDPVGMVPLCTQWWAEKMPFNFKPPSLEEHHVKALNTTVNALDYGYQIEECNVTGTSYGSAKISVLVPHSDLLNLPFDHRASGYIAARGAWTQAIDAINTRTPLEYRGLSTNKSKFAQYTNTEERTGLIVKTADGVYVKGKFASKKNWEDQTKLDTWHRLHAPCKRTKLG